MVVRIRTGKRIQGALSYNERKVMTGKAELILASRLGCELSSLDFADKLNRFEALNSRSQNTTTNTIHLSINFSPYDQIDTEKMQVIAMDYMKRIGFGNQPFLVYRHNDANHPHIHIVSTIIKPCGRPIKVHNIGKRLSEPARKEIEKEYNLIAAESMKREISLPLAKTSLKNIVQEVTSSYHFSTLDELNAILKDFNVIADPGLPGSRIREKNGLIYSKTDVQGNKIGAPIKASDLYTKPTLPNLEKKFTKETARKQLYVKRTNDAVSYILSRDRNITEKRFREILGRRKVSCRFVKDENGKLSDVRFVDHFSKVVLNTSDIQIPLSKFEARLIPDNRQFQSPTPNFKKQCYQSNQTDISQLTLKLMKGLLGHENSSQSLPSEFMKKKRKKRRHRF